MRYLRALKKCYWPQWPDNALQRDRIRWTQAWLDALDDPAWLDALDDPEDSEVETVVGEYY